MDKYADSIRIQRGEQEASAASIPKTNHHSTIDLNMSNYLKSSVNSKKNNNHFSTKYPSPSKFNVRGPSPFNPNKSL